jgi:hypothetical protein
VLVIVARPGNEIKARPIPTGQLVTKIAIARTISRSANQSVTIFARTVFKKTAPMPLNRRAAARSGTEEPTASRTPPRTINVRPITAIRMSPKRWPNTPPGNAKTTPGSMKKPMTVPSRA